MPNSQADLQLLRMLSERLERISVDSIWAHQASGLRGALLREIEMSEEHTPNRNAQWHALIAHGFRILEAAANRKRS